MITWFLVLVSLFCESSQKGHEKENSVLHCGPQNLTLSYSDHMILTTWGDDPSCSALQDVLIYELVVLREDKQVHREEVAVTPEEIGSTHSWNWKSDLPLECASHSVRITSLYNNQRSPRTQEETLQGKTKNPKKAEVFPKDKVLEVGSEFTFCCVLLPGEVLKSLSMTGYSVSHKQATKINNHTYAWTVLLDSPSVNSGTDVKCEGSGASVYISRPPADKDLWCETQDLESVDCHWTLGPKSNLPKHRISTKYYLVGNHCDKGSEGRCSQKVEVEGGERNWTLTAQNQLGKVELTDRVDLMKRVHMVAPKEVSASTVNTRNVTLTWKWEKQRYNNLDISCQVNVSRGGTYKMSKASGVGLCSALVTDLIPYWTYDVTVRCAATQHFWKWSNWSQSVNFSTRGGVPDALDVWMQMKDKQTIIVWKELQDDQSHGDIIDYEVSWKKTTGSELQNTSRVDSKHRRLELHLDPSEEYIVTATARNINGSSSPSSLIWRVANNRTSTSQIVGSDGGFFLSWAVSSAASCGYIVDWCPTSGPCDVEWLRVPPNETNARIISKNFKDGQRYSLSVYACTDGAPVFVAGREGYVKEKRIEDEQFNPLTLKQKNSDVEVSWNPVSLGDQTAFIRGFVLYCFQNNTMVHNVSTDDPKATSLTAIGLKFGTYTFTLRAKTAVGECGDTSIDATLNSLTDNLITVVSVSLVTVFGLLSIITILIFRQWSRIKQELCPTIPKPALDDRWLTKDETYYAAIKADTVEVPELLCDLIPVEDNVIQEKMSYYNQPPEKSIPQPLSLPTSAAPPEPAAPAPLFMSLFPNPSYRLTTELGYQPCSSGPEPQQGTDTETSHNGYQPQPQIQTESFSTNQEEECPDSPMSCVSTYILLPQSPHSSLTPPPSTH